MFHYQTVQLSTSARALYSLPSTTTTDQPNALPFCCTSVFVPSSPDWSVRLGRLLLLLFAVSLSTLNQNNMIIINVKSDRPRRLGRTLSSERNQSSRVSTDPSLILLWCTGAQLRIIVNRLKETVTSSGRLNFCSQRLLRDCSRYNKKTTFMGVLLLLLWKTTQFCEFWLLKSVGKSEWKLCKRERNREKCVPVVSRVETKFYGFSSY